LRDPSTTFRAGIAGNAPAVRLHFGVRRSMFDVRCSMFGVRRSAFGVRRSAFGVRRSAFGGPINNNFPPPTYSRISGGKTRYPSRLNRADWAAVNTISSEGARANANSINHRAFVDCGLRGNQGAEVDCRKGSRAEKPGIPTSRHHVRAEDNGRRAPRAAMDI
jgi:hypothetical protein